MDLENFATAYRSPKRVIDLAQEGGRSEREKLDRRRQTKLIIPRSSRRTTTVVYLVYRTYHQALSTERFCPVGQFATADTCLADIWKLLCFGFGQQ